MIVNLNNNQKLQIKQKSNSLEKLMTFPANKKRQKNKHSSKLLVGIKIGATFVKDSLAPFIENLENVHSI